MSSEAMVTSEGHAAQALTAMEGGVMTLALMDEADFAARLEILRRGQERVRQIQKELMEEDEDYGVIPGTKKPTLLKPGAEKLCMFYGLVPTFREEWIEGDGYSRPHLRVKVTCSLHRGHKKGPVVGSGAGASNSWEKKHRYRSAQKACPACGVVGAVIKGKEEYGGGWLCWNKNGGCNAKFKDHDARITEQVVGQIENPDPFDTENTLLKMAMKRAQVDATLRTTATSGLFTQDLEDDPENTEPKRDRERKPSTRQAPSTERGRSDVVDAEVMDSAGKPLAPEAERVKASGAEPNATYAGEQPCPTCQTPGKPWRNARNGMTHFCEKCRQPFAASSVAA
jgi:hypothetical protein